MGAALAVTGVLSAAKAGYDVPQASAPPTAPAARPGRKKTRLGSAADLAAPRTGEHTGHHYSRAQHTRLTAITWTVVRVPRYPRPCG